MLRGIEENPICLARLPQKCVLELFWIMTGDRYSLYTLQVVVDMHKSVPVPEPTSLLYRTAQKVKAHPPKPLLGYTFSTQQGVKIFCADIHTSSMCSCCEIVGPQGGKNATYGPAWEGMFVPVTNPKTKNRYPSGRMVPDLAKEVIKCVYPPLILKDVLLHMYSEPFESGFSSLHKKR